MPVTPKTTARQDTALTFRARADAIRAELLDETKELSKTEVEEKTAAMNAWLARAAAAMEATPEEEIDRQGGDEELQVLNPERAEETKEGRSYREQYAQLCQRAEKVFGSPNRYLLRLAQRGAPNMPRWTDREERVLREITAFQQRATIIGDTNDASGAEFLLPLQQVQEIFRVPNEQVGVLQYARRYPVSGRTLRIPYVKQDQAANTRPLAGIANVGIVGEAQQKDEREPAFGQRLLTVFKYQAYTEIGDEVLADDMTGQLSSVVQDQIGAQLMNAINEDVTADGSGTSEPLAALHANNGALLVVNRDTSQQIKSADIFAMYAKHTFGGGQSFWLINRTALPQLFSLTLGTNTLVTWISDLRSQPQMMLMGLPVYMTDLTAVLGVQGDLALCNGGFYALALRQALTVQSSIHYKFRNDLTAYRFVGRAGGIPIPTDTYAYKSDGSTKQAEHSPFVVLGDDATS